MPAPHCAAVGHAAASSPCAARPARFFIYAQHTTQGRSSRPPHTCSPCRFQHVPPCTNATHAHPATSRHHAPASRAPLPRRTCARHIPAFTRQRATHACHTAHAHAYPRRHAPASLARLPHRTGARIPLLMRRGRHSWRRVRRTASPAETLEIGRTPLPACAVVHQRDTRSPCHIPPSRASKSRTPATPHTRTPAASNAALGVIHGAGWGARRLPAETLEIGLPPSPACAAMHQCDTRAHCHTSAIHAPASRARLPHPAGARIPPPSRASKPRAPAHPAASNAARASWWRRWSWRWE